MTNGVFLIAVALGLLISAALFGGKAKVWSIGGIFKKNKDGSMVLVLSKPTRKKGRRR